MIAKCQIIALFYEIGITESNGDVRILIVSSEIAVCELCVHAQYKYGKKARTTGETSCGLAVAMQLQMPRF